MKNVKSTKTVEDILTITIMVAIICLQSLIKAIKTKPSSRSSFCGRMDNILLADTYIITAIHGFVKLKLLI